MSENETKHFDKKPKSKVAADIINELENIL